MSSEDKPLTPPPSRDRRQICRPFPGPPVVMASSFICCGMDILKVKRDNLKI